MSLASPSVAPWQEGRTQLKFPACAELLEMFWGKEAWESDHRINRHFPSQPEELNKKGLENTEAEVLSALYIY